MITHLGDINLGDVRGVHGASLRIGYDFATHDKPLGKPSKQKLGGKLDEWRLNFKLVHQFCDPQTMLDKIKAACTNGEPMPLVFDYLAYQGWVTLDSVDVTYQEVAPNGRPLVITGSLKLTEFVGNTQTPTPAPAVRSSDESLSNPAPVQTAMTDDVTTLLPHRQPMQHLQEALIAQHKAQRLLRDIEDIETDDREARITAFNNSVNTVNGYFESRDYKGDNVAPLPHIQGLDTTQAVQAMISRQRFFLELIRRTANRWL